MYVDIKPSQSKFEKGYVDETQRFNQ